MKQLTTAVVAVLLTASVLVAEEEKAEKAKDWQDEIVQKLQTTVTLDKKATLKQALANISAMSGVTIILDDRLPESNNVIAIQAKDESLQIVLGKVLKQAGLRYTLKDGGVYVSRAQDLIAMLLSGDEQEGEEEAQPLTPADALRLSGETKFEDIPDLSNPYDAIGFEPWRKPEAPYVDPRTGITHFPAPPIWVEAEDADNPRFKFSDTPSFLKAEHLWEEVYSKDKAQLEEAELLGRLTRLLQSNPKFSQKEVLEQFIKFLEAESKKAEK